MNGRVRVYLNLYYIVWTLEPTEEGSRGSDQYDVGRKSKSPTQINEWGKRIRPGDLRVGGPFKKSFGRWWQFGEPTGPIGKWPAELQIWEFHTWKEIRQIWELQKIYGTGSNFLGNADAKLRPNKTNLGSCKIKTEKRYTWQLAFVFAAKAQTLSPGTYRSAHISAQASSICFLAFGRVIGSVRPGSLWYFGRAKKNKKQFRTLLLFLHFIFYSALGVM